MKSAKIPSSPMDRDFSWLIGAMVERHSLGFETTLSTFELALDGQYDELAESQLKHPIKGLFLD